MAIVNMKEFKLFIFDDSREKLIDRFQKFNYVHIVESDFDKDEYIEDDFARPKSLDDLIEIDDKIKRSKDDIDLLLKFKEKESAIKSLKDGVENITLEAVSYTHLTLPTICSV